MAFVRPDHTIRSFSGHGMTITHTTGGGRVIYTERADHTVVFANHAGYGYVQRPFVYGNREFARRSYFVNGVRYDRFYQRYGYHGIFLNVYAPAVYYSPGFYGWAYRPWGPSITFGWGWGGSPWYGYYGPYFAPYPVYPSAAYWMTDYLISQSLAASYQAQIAAGGPPPPPQGGVPMSPQVKGYIEAEVQRQIALANYEGQQQVKGYVADPASSGIARILSDGAPHVFVAANPLSLVDAGGAECQVTEGDTLQFTPPSPAADAQAVNVQVLWSKGPDCRVGNTVTVALGDLQEMQNHMRGTIDQALAELRTQQGEGKIPAAPPAAGGAPIPSSFASIAPPPDPNVSTEIGEQIQQADQAEKEVQRP